MSDFKNDGLASDGIPASANRESVRHPNVNILLKYFLWWIICQLLVLGFAGGDIAWKAKNNRVDWCGNTGSLWQYRAVGVLVPLIVFTPPSDNCSTVQFISSKPQSPNVARSEEVQAEDRGKAKP